MFTYLLQMLSSYFRIDPTELIWAQATIDDGRTLLVAWGYTEDDAKEALQNHHNKTVITHPDGLLKVIISNDVEVIPTEVIEWVSNHMGFPMPVQESSKKEKSA